MVLMKLMNESRQNDPCAAVSSHLKAIPHSVKDL